MKKQDWTKKMTGFALAGIFAAGAMAFGGVAQAAEAQDYPPVEEVVAGLEQGTARSSRSASPTSPMSSISSAKPSTPDLQRIESAYRM